MALLSYAIKVSVQYPIYVSDDTLDDYRKPSLP